MKLMCHTFVMNVSYTHSLWVKVICIYIYPFGRCFHPKRLANGIVLVL